MKEVSCPWDVKKMGYTGTCEVVEDAVRGTIEK
jgi:hypothetical protein